MPTAACSTNKGIKRRQLLARRHVFAKGAGMRVKRGDEAVAKIPSFLPPPYWKSLSECRKDVLAFVCLAKGILSLSAHVLPLADA